MFELKSNANDHRIVQVRLERRLGAGMGILQKKLALKLLEKMQKDGLTILDVYDELKRLGLDK